MRIALAVTFAALAATSMVAQQAPSTLAKQTVPRTPDGKPDLQGIWSNATITPLERPQNITNLVLSEDEAARMEKAVVDRRDKDSRGV